MLITRIVQVIMVTGTLAIVAYALRTVTLDRRTYRVVADGEVLYTGLPHDEAEWNAHDAWRTNWYDAVNVERE